MGSGSDVDQRRHRIGSVVPFRVILGRTGALTRELRKSRLSESPYVRKEVRLERPGFEVPQIVSGVLCSRYFEEEMLDVEVFGDVRPQITVVHTSFFDML